MKNTIKIMIKKKIDKIIISTFCKVNYIIIFLIILNCSHNKYIEPDLPTEKCGIIKIVCVEQKYLYTAMHDLVMKIDNKQYHYDEKVGDKVLDHEEIINGIKNKYYEISVKVPPDSHCVEFSYRCEYRDVSIVDPKPNTICLNILAGHIYKFDFSMRYNKYKKEGVVGMYFKLFNDILDGFDIGKVSYSVTDLNTNKNYSKLSKKLKLILPKN